MDPTTPEEHQAVREAQEARLDYECRRVAASHGGPEARAAFDAQNEEPASWPD